MFGRAYFGGRYFGPSFFGEGGSAPAPTSSKSGVSRLWLYDYYAKQNQERDARAQAEVVAKLPPKEAKKVANRKTKQPRRETQEEQYVPRHYPVVLKDEFQNQPTISELISDIIQRLPAPMPPIAKPQPKQIKKTLSIDEDDEEVLMLLFL